MTRVLFVCLGNICRSPTAQAVTTQLADAQGVSLDCDSAGTAGWHEGNPPYAPMQEAAAPRGYNMAHLKARQATPRDFHRFDLIVAMDAKNMTDLDAMRPPDATASLALFTDFAPQIGADHVPDPYYTRDFEGALDLIEACATGLIQHLQKRP